MSEVGAALATLRASELHAGYFRFTCPACGADSASYEAAVEAWYCTACTRGGSQRDLAHRVAIPHRANQGNQANRENRDFVSVAPPVPPAETKLRWWTAYEIGQSLEPATTWRAHGLLADGAITELDGKVKRAGKTTFLLGMCAAILDGSLFLGQPTTRTSIVYLTEQAPRTFREALRRAGLLERRDLHVLYWHDTRGTSWPEIVAAAALKCTAVDAHALVVDTLGQFTGLKGDAENSAGDALQAVQPLQEAASSRPDLAVLFSRHERKAGGEVGDSGRGSSAFAGAVDIVLSLRRPDGAARPTLRLVQGLSRFDETPDSLVVELTPAGYVALGDESVLAAETARVAILDCAPVGADLARTAEELLTTADVRRTLGKRILSDLLADELMMRLGEGKRGSPYRYFRPTEDEKNRFCQTPLRGSAKETIPDQFYADWEDAEEPREEPLPW